MKLRKPSIFLIPLVLLVSALLGGMYGPRVTAQSDDSDARVQDSLRRITQVLRTAEQNYADPVDTEKAIFSGAIPGMLHTLDPHSNFFDPKSFAQLRDDQRGRYYGVGMSVMPLNGKTVIMTPFPGSPAYKAGLRTGDVIVAVDDRRTDNLSTTEVAEMLKGPRGTTVKILVEREGTPEPLPFTITRDEIPRFSIDHAFELAPGVAYVRITQFNETTSQELRQKLSQLNAQELTGLVLDLRGNPGGLLSEGVAVAEMFLQRGQLIVSHRGRASKEKQYMARGNRSLSTPLVIVINRGTASAAEIVSGAIQDHDRGLIIGETSFGKGLVQTVYPLSDNTGLALTTAKYYTPSGRLIQRDYSDVSEYDYRYLRGGSSNAEVKSTDTGRQVYGGGGITPDVPLPEPKLNRFQQILGRNDVFFNFAKRYLAENKTIDRDFEVTPAVMDRFRQFLQEKQVPFTEGEITDNLDYIKRQIKLQLVLTIYGMDDAFRLEKAADPQIQKAMDLLPQAAAMLENTRRAQLEQQAR